MDLGTNVRIAKRRKERSEKMGFRERKLRKQLGEFLELLHKVDEMEFFGVAKILGVAQDKEFEDIAQSMIFKFAEIHPRARKQILKLMRLSTSASFTDKGEEKNG
jgi:hypothetical protein